MRIDSCKAVGLAFVCFAMGTIIQIFIPNLFIVILFAGLLLFAGILLLKL